jgi:surface polysaccharide O-acyltransferase-like enzyme
MNIQQASAIEPDTPRASIAIDNLRGIVVLLVIAVHTALAYAAYAVAAPWAFNKSPYPWRTFPVIDGHRFIGFDIFCAWANICLMPLFFLVSGFFVWNSLERSGALGFAQRRVLRLGPPFVLGVALIMPIAVFPAYAERTLHPGLGDYFNQLLALPFWPDGPMWFLWVLMIFDLLAAGLFAASTRARNVVRQIAFRAGREPMHFLAGFFALSALAYIPLGTIFGPMRWFQWGPFSFQLNFIGLYVVYFGAGVVIGASGLECGLLGPRFARQWKRVLLTAAALFLIWLLVSAKTFTTPEASSAWMLADAVALVPACFASCLCALFFAMQFGRVRTRLLQSLQANAFGMYWVHYAVVIWLEFALLAVPCPALVKAPIVFTGAAALSWMIAVGLRRVPVLNGVVGVPPRRPSIPATVFSNPLTLSD